MCDVVCVRGEWCEMVGELRDALPGVPLVRDTNYVAESRLMSADHHCLCGVDLPATLTAAGLMWQRDACGDYHAWEKEPQRCHRCDGDGKAHGSDRPFEWSGPWTYPGPCPVCGGTGIEPKATP